MITWKDIKHFKPVEFACRCGKCNSTGHEMNMYFIHALDQLRHQFGRPINVASGYRCPAYNDHISLTGEDGPHTTGRAVDIRVSGTQVYYLFQQCNMCDAMTGIGLNQKGLHKDRFIHLDDLKLPGHPRPRIWTY